MMAYLTRPGFNGGGAVSNRTVLPKRKPAAEVKKRKKINYEKIKQYLGKESQELIERELGFAVGGRVNPAQLKQRFIQLVSSIQDADDAEIPGIVAQAKQIRDQINEINLTLAPERQIKITAQGIDFDNPLLDAAKIAQTVDTTQEVTGGLTKNIVKDIVPESLTTRNPIYKGQPTPAFPKGTKGTLADEEEKQDPKIDRRVGIDPTGKAVQAAARIRNITDINFQKLKNIFKSVEPEVTSDEGFAEGGRIGFLRGGEVKFRKGAYTVSGKLYPGKSFTYDYKGEKGKVFEGPPEGSKKKFNTFELRFKTKAEAQAALDSINQQRTGGKNLTAKKFAELRTNNINKFLTTDEFAQKLNRYGYRNMKGELFDGKQIRDRQQGLDVPGRERGTLKPGEKPVTPAVQKKLKANFPEVEFDFKKYKYGTLQRIVGKDTYMAIFHNSIDQSKRWPQGLKPKDRLWYNAYRSALQGDRYKILTKEGNPLTLDEIKNANFSKNSKAQTFLDTKTGKTFTYDTFENWINNDSVQGMPNPDRYNEAAKQYQLTADLKKVKIGNQTLGEILLKKLRPKDQVGPFGVFHNHHVFDITQNFWDTEPVFYKTNLEVRRFETPIRKILRDYEGATPQAQKKILKNIMETNLKDFGSRIQSDYKVDPKKKFKDIKGIEIGVGDQRAGQYNLRTVIKQAVDEAGLDKTIVTKAINALRKMGYRCLKQKGGTEDLACYLDDVNRTRDEMRSPDVETRAKAITRQRNAFSVAQKVPGILDDIRKIGNAGAKVAAGTFGIIGGFPGLVLEGLFELGTYDNARQRGLTHKQAAAETFFAKKMGLGDLQPGEGRGFLEGSESLLQKELIGGDAATQKFFDIQSMIESEGSKIGQLQEEIKALEVGTRATLPGTPEEIASKKEQLEQLIKNYSNLENQIKPGSPLYEAYLIRAEIQEARQAERREKLRQSSYITGLPETQMTKENRERDTRQRRERERKEFVGNRDAILFYPDIDKTFRDAGIDPTKNKFAFIRQAGGLDLLDKIGIAGGVSKLAGGGIAKEGGVESGVAPESGPNSQGLAFLMKRGK